MIFVIILKIIGIVFCSFLFLCVLCWLCDSNKRKPKISEEKNAELIRICTESDVDKLRSLLKKGLDPNTKVRMTYNVYGDYDSAVPEYVYEPLIVVAQFNKPIKDLLIAYGAITRGDFKAE